MLAVCGMATAEALYDHLPTEAKLNRPLKLAPGISEYEIIDFFKDRARDTSEGYASFLGAGVYCHFRPVMCDTIVSRGEFLTSYTPYQAEIAQGTLTAIFEFQTMICQLTGMDVANASMYDGSTAVPEAAMMAVRVTGRSKILVSHVVHPEYREVLTTYAKHQGIPVEEFGYNAETGQLDLEDLEAKLDQETAAVIIQSPNFFGVIEQVQAAADLAHKRGALLIFVFTEAASLGFSNRPPMPTLSRANSNPSLSLRPMADHMPASSPRKKSSCVNFPDAWSARLSIRTAIALSASRSPRANNISAARKRPRISAPTKP